MEGLHYGDLQYYCLSYLGLMLPERNEETKFIDFFNKIVRKSVIYLKTYHKYYHYGK